jgi:hypothetical protein
MGTVTEDVSEGIGMDVVDAIEQGALLKESMNSIETDSLLFDIANRSIYL